MASLCKSTCMGFIRKLFSTVVEYEGSSLTAPACVWFQVMLTGDVSEIGGFRLFRSQDFGMTFVPTDLPFEPLMQMLYNPGDCNTLLTLSITVSLFMFWPD